MRFDIVTIFPEFFSGPLDWGVIRRARNAGIIEAEVHDLRQWTHDRHLTTDDRPFGGGEGMVMKPEPVFEAVEAITGQQETATGAGTAIVLLSAAGKKFNQAAAERLSRLQRIVLLCGRYEGVDERIAEHLADEELSVGDFVLSGGELAAAMVMDVVTRLLPGALGNADSAVNESFTRGETPGDTAHMELPETMKRRAEQAAAESAGGILDYPHYTRPQVFRGWEVPAVLISGDHQHVKRWRRKAALQKTLRNRPELLLRLPLTREDRALLEEIQSESVTG
jgi:tRNA (guanine37-N1)-methyltransferase